MRWDVMLREIRARIRTLLSNLEPQWVEVLDTSYSRKTRGVSVEYWIQTGATVPLALGAFSGQSEEGERTSGFIQFDLYRPIRESTEEQEQIAETIRQAFRGQVVNVPGEGKVRFDRESPTLNDLGRDATHHRVAVTCPFYADDL